MPSDLKFLIYKYEIIIYIWVCLRIFFFFYKSFYFVFCAIVVLHNILPIKEYLFVSFFIFLKILMISLTFIHIKFLMISFTFHIYILGCYYKMSHFPIILFDNCWSIGKWLVFVYFFLPCCLPNFQLTRIVFQLDFLGQIRLLPVNKDDLISFSLDIYFFLFYCYG